MNRRFVNNSSNWEAEIKAAYDELRLHGHEMSPYERNVISREIKRRQDELIPTVGSLVISEFKGAITKYKSALQQIDAERTKEINRFDSAKLNQEMQLLQTRVDLAIQQGADVLHGDASVSVKLQQIYGEAVQSGDLHKQRAAVEVIKSVLPRVSGPDRIAVNQLARAAEKVEPELRQTDGTRQAEQARLAALGELHAKHEQLNKVSTLFGMGDVNDGLNPSPFAKAARQVKFTPDGPQIYDENAPEVTGVYWKNAPTIGA